MKTTDITGQKFGKLTAIKRIYDNRKQVRYLFKCDCGNEKIILKSAVISGKTKSCGCLNREAVGKRSFKDLTGQRFGKLIAISIDHKINGKIYWKCICDCGNEHVVLTNKLTSGNTVSCGCHKKQIVQSIGELNKSHNMANTRIYKTYLGMKQRCYKTYSSSYLRYGVRGITVCREWLDDFMNFYKWAMENGYDDNLSIDRIDNDKGYSPDNCRWVDAKKQANNTRNTILLTYNGETKPASEWAEITGINQKTITRRKRDGWTDEECLTIKIGEKRA